VTTIREHNLNFLKIAFNNLLGHEPFNLADINQQDVEFLAAFRKLVTDFENGEDVFDKGEELLCRAFRAYPHLTHLIARDLLWYFGGSCLHNMPDDEIAKFQRLDEMRFAAEETDEPFDYLKARASVFEQN